MSHNKNGFTLNDVIYLNQSYINKFQRIGIISLRDISSCDPIDLVHELNISLRTAELISYHSKLFLRGKIPVSQLPSTSEIVWISSEVNNTVNVLHLSVDNQISMYSHLESDNLKCIIQETQPLVIGNQLDYLGYYNYWTNYLSRNVFNAVSTSHDYLYSAMMDQDHRTHASLVKAEYEGQYYLNNAIEIELVSKLLTEVNWILHHLIQVKQDFKSFKASSSVSKTANKPPKL